MKGIPETKRGDVNKNKMQASILNYFTPILAGASVASERGPPLEDSVTLDTIKNTSFRPLDSVRADGDIKKSANISIFPSKRRSEARGGANGARDLRAWRVEVCGMILTLLMVALTFFFCA